MKPFPKVNMRRSTRFKNYWHPSAKKPRADGTFFPADIAEAYQFPQNLPAGGAIAIIELGGGWIPSDMTTYFAAIGQPVPDITDIDVGGVTNSPGGDADVEVALDIQNAAGVYFYATGKPAVVRMYWANDFAPAIQQIIADKAAGVPIAAVSISWGADEASSGSDYCQQQDAVFAGLVAAGIPFFAAAGDNDSSDGGNGQNVDFPSSSPNVIGCGGTTKTANSEVVWNNGGGEGTGGGYSQVFPAQQWQIGAPPNPIGSNGRMVPDVAANADPQTGYNVYVDGSWGVVGGTSAVAPLYAGLFAAINAGGDSLKTVWENEEWFTDITQGGNGSYSALTGPDPCTGLGVPIGEQIAKGLTGGTSPLPPVPLPPGPTPLPPTPVPTQPAITVSGTLDIPGLLGKDRQGTFTGTVAMPPPAAPDPSTINWAGLLAFLEALLAALQSSGILDSATAAKALAKLKA